MKKNSAILNSGAEPETFPVFSGQNQDARSRSVSPWEKTRFPQRYQSGIQTAQELFALASRREDHQIFLFCGGAKTPIIQTLFRKEFIAEF